LVLFLFPDTSRKTQPTRASSETIRDRDASLLAKLIGTRRSVLCANHLSSRKYRNSAIVFRIGRRVARPIDFVTCPRKSRCESSVTAEISRDRPRGGKGIKSRRTIRLCYLKQEKRKQEGRLKSSRSRPTQFTAARPAIHASRLISRASCIASNQLRPRNDRSCAPRLPVKDSSRRVLRCFDERERLKDEDF